MTLNPIGIAVPFFFGLLAVEWWLARGRGLRLHRMNDALANLTCGLGDQLIGLFVGGLTLGLYMVTEANLGLFELAIDSPVVWIFGIFAVDFLYYCFHRFAHRVGIGWATHVVHHQSEDYNFAVALRQPWFTQLYAWLFYIPLALLGLPWEIYAASYAFNLIYQFWIHTELIGKLGPVEWVMNTPSHHRVHHGINDPYIDKNYAGVFIIWDRLLGTFEEEDERVLFGTRKPLQNWNPWTANTEPLLDLWRRSKATPDPGDKKRVWWAPPEWTAEGEQPGAGCPPPGRGYDRDIGPGVHTYALGQLGVLVVLMTVLLTFEAYIPLAPKVLASFFIMWTGVTWGGLFEQRRWAMAAEWIRLGTLVGVGLFLSTLGPDFVVVGYGIVAIAITSALALWRCRDDLVVRVS
jgi:alkylglycerol monooxygenase